MKIKKMLLFVAMNKKTATLLLLLTALIWGCSFVAQDVSSDYLGPFTFNFVRFFIGSAVLLPFVLNSRKKRKITIVVSQNIGLRILSRPASWTFRFVRYRLLFSWSTRISFHLCTSSNI